MLPAVEIFGFKVAMYGLLIVVGVGLGMAVAALRAKKNGQTAQDVLFGGIFAIIGLVIGAKLLYLATILPGIVRNFSYLLDHPESIAALLSGGFVFYGGLIGGIFGRWVYTRMYKLNFWGMTDALVPSVPLMHAFGRLGCFCAGCCYGMPFPAPLGLSFDASPVAPHGVTLFPVQLLEAFLNLIIFGVLLLYARKPRGRGKIIGLYMSAYAVMRFLLEFLRFDAERGGFWGLSTSQWISLILLPIGLYLLLTNKNKKQNQAGSSEASRSQC